MKMLIEKWTEQHWPKFNGVTFADGRCYSIRPVDSPRGPLPMALTYLEHTKIESIINFDCTFLIEACEAEDKKSGLKAVGGECSLGEEGFVALLEVTGALLWVAYFDFSNPFVSVRFENDEVLAKNNLGETWHLPLAAPWSITVTATKHKVGE